MKPASTANGGNTLMKWWNHNSDCKISPAKKIKNQKGANQRRQSLRRKAYNMPTNPASIKPGSLARNSWVTCNFVHHVCGGFFNWYKIVLSIIAWASTVRRESRGKIAEIAKKQIPLTSLFQTRYATTTTSGINAKNFAKMQSPKMKPDPHSHLRSSFLR